jgi:hypothetical protein
MSDPAPHDVQLLLYGFDADARFEGRLVGALERMESGGTLRILEAMFLARDAETGELAAVDLRSRGTGSLVAPLIGFRLDAHERKRATERALGSDVGDALRGLGAALAPGDAIAAVLVEHTWSQTLEDAVAQSGGTRISSGFFEVRTLAELLPQLVSAATAPNAATRRAT